MKSTSIAAVATAIVACLTVSSCQKDEPVKEAPEHYVAIGDITRECRIAAVGYPWGTSSWPRFVLSWDSSVTSLTQMWDYVGILIPNTWYGKDIDLTEVTTGSEYWTFRYYDYYANYNFTVQSWTQEQVDMLEEGSTLRVDKLESEEGGPERFRIQFSIRFKGELFALDYYHLYHGNIVPLEGYYEGEVLRDTERKFTGNRSWDAYFGQYL